MLAPPKIYLFSSKPLQITRNHETPLFTTLLAMVFNTAFLLQRCLKLLENHGACRPIVCQPPCARRPFILFVSACASAAPARRTRFVNKLYTTRGFGGHWGSNLGPPASEGRPSPIELHMQLPSGPLLVPSPV